MNIHRPDIHKDRHVDNRDTTYTDTYRTYTDTDTQTLTQTHRVAQIISMR